MRHGFLDFHHEQTPKGGKAFTLVELLTVMGIIVVIMALAIPAFNSIKGGSDIAKAIDSISGAFEQARTYAMANNTYVWVGFYEEDGSKLSTDPVSPGIGRLVIMTVASSDGTSYGNLLVDASHPAPFGAGDSSNQVSLVAINKPVKLDNIHMASLNDNVATSSKNNPPRPPVPTAYQVGDPGFTMHGANIVNPTTFTFPVTTGTHASHAQYTFVNIVEFNPQGEPSKIVDGVVNGPQSWLELAFQPTHGNVVDPKYAGTIKAAGALMIEGITGRVLIYKL